MSTLYRIRDWDRLYENAESRKCKTLTWLKLPIKITGNGYCALMEREDGGALFGCFIALLEYAGGLLERGTFTDSKGKPLTPKVISRAIRMPEILVTQTIETLSSGEFDWIEIVTPGEGVGRLVGEQSSVLGEQSRQIKRIGDLEERREEPEESRGDESQRAGFSGRGAVDSRTPAANGSPGHQPPPNPIREISDALEEAVGRPVDAETPHRLCRETAAAGIHPHLTARWIREKGAERRKSSPIRTPGIFLEDWPAELRAWVSANLGALVGGRHALVESPGCGRCGSQMFRFEDGCIVPCACKPMPGLVRARPPVRAPAG